VIALAILVGAGAVVLAVGFGVIRCLRWREQRRLERQRAEEFALAFQQAVEDALGRFAENWKEMWGEIADRKLAQPWESLSKAIADFESEILANLEEEDPS